MLTIAIQVDDPASFNPETDSTLHLGLEAQARGHRLYWFPPGDLFYKEGAICARAQAITFFDDPAHWYQAGPTETLDLATADVVLIRQNPPFDRAYLSTTYLLERLPASTRVVNAPQALRDWPEKLSIMRFPEFIPPTMVTRDVETIAAFHREHGEVVIKPLFGYGGQGVFHLQKDTANLYALTELLLENSQEPLMVQRFIPEVRSEEKRLLLIDGKFAGALGRLPKEGEIRSNMRVGGKPVVTELTARERELCEALGPELKQAGVLLAGVDSIGGTLIEVNITSPTGLQSLHRLTGERPGVMFWDALEG